MSQMAALRARLELPDEAPIMLQRMSFEQWGAQITLFGEADAAAFRLVFGEVRDLRWRTYVTAETPDPAATLPPTQLVDFSFGRDQHRSPAQLLTAHFGVSLFYGTLALEILEPPE